MDKTVPNRNHAAAPAAGSSAMAASRGANEISAGDKTAPRPIVQIVYGPQGRETPPSDAPETRRAILLIEDNTYDADRCRSVLKEMGYDGIQLITTLQQAEEYLDDVLNHLTHPPQAIVLDLGLGFDSGFGLLRKCHGHPRLREVPILVWSRSAESHTEVLSARLGAKDFLVKSPDMEALRTTLQKLLATT